MKWLLLAGLVGSMPILVQGQECHLDPKNYWYGDADYDGDVDMQDFMAFNACYNGPNRPIPILQKWDEQRQCWTGPDCLRFDWGDYPADAPKMDDDIDLDDFSAFQRCYNGPNRPPREANCWKVGPTVEDGYAEIEVIP